MVYSCTDGDNKETLLYPTLMFIDVFMYIVYNHVTLYITHR